MVRKNQDSLKIKKQMDKWITEHIRDQNYIM